MVNYQKGKIYKIIGGSGQTYIGSTTTSLRQRLVEHKSVKKRYENGKIISKNSVFPILDEANYDIILIENYPCNNKEELHSRERYWIETINCVNKIIPTRTKEEYRQHYKDKIKEDNKKWEEKNNKQMNCECGGTYMSSKHKARHLRTKKHQLFLINI
jgi:GIY-YIG catalytic domain